MATAARDGIAVVAAAVTAVTLPARASAAGDATKAASDDPVVFLRFATTVSMAVAAVGGEALSASAASVRFFLLSTTCTAAAAALGADAGTVGGASLLALRRGRGAAEGTSLSNCGGSGADFPLRCAFARGCCLLPSEACCCAAAGETDLVVGASFLEALAGAAASAVVGLALAGTAGVLSLGDWRRLVPLSGTGAWTSSSYRIASGSMNVDLGRPRFPCKSVVLSHVDSLTHRYHSITSTCLAMPGR